MAVSILVAVVYLAGATTAPSKECVYLELVFGGDAIIDVYGTVLKTADFPSVSTTCISAINALFSGDLKYFPNVCGPTCQSFYDLYSSCHHTEEADMLFGSLCGTYGTYKYCPVLYNSTDYSKYSYSISQACSVNTCNSSCRSAITTMDTYAGCCAADEVNLAKITCGMNTVAPCPTAFNQAPTAPNKECVYLDEAFRTEDIMQLNASNLPSVDSKCIGAINSLVSAPAGVNGYPDLKYYQSVCSPTCQSFYDLYSSCHNTDDADMFIGSFCGKYSAKYCPEVYNGTTYKDYAYSFFQVCSGDVCNTTCKSAINALSGYAGCCAAGSTFNEYKVTCGMNTVAPCPTIFSAAAVVGIGTIAMACSIIAALWL